MGTDLNHAIGFDGDSTNWHSTRRCIFVVAIAVLRPCSKRWNGLGMTGSRHVRASQAGIFTTMLPISACVVGWLLGEQTNLIQWIALGLSLFAVVLATKK